MSEFQSERSEMSSVSEASTLLRRVAGPRSAGDSVKAMIRRAASRLRWSFTRTKDVWYLDARRIDAAEMDRLRDEATQVEVRVHVQSLVALRAQLAAVDEDFHRPAIAALDDALRSMGAGHGPMAVRKRPSVTLNSKA